MALHDLIHSAICPFASNVNGRNVYLFDPAHPKSSSHTIIAQANPTHWIFNKIYKFVIKHKRERERESSCKWAFCRYFGEQHKCLQWVMEIVEQPQVENEIETFIK